MNIFVKFHKFFEYSCEISQISQKYCEISQILEYSVKFHKFHENFCEICTFTIWNFFPRPLFKKGHFSDLRVGGVISRNRVYT